MSSLRPFADHLRMGIAVKITRTTGAQVLYLFALIVMVGLIVGCGSGDSESEAVSGDSDQQDLAGTSWSLSLLRGDGLLLLSIVIAEFDQDGSVSGIAGCNGYTASYDTEGDQISITNVVTTSSTCRDRLMSQETSYLETLETVVSYQVLGTTLEMRDAEGRAMLVYDTLAQTTLPGSSWMLTEYDDGSGTIVPVIPGTTVSAEFGDEGLLTGSAGCNGYSASYNVASNLIKIDAIVMTEIYCMEPEGLMDQESQYLSALEQSSAFAIVGKAMGLVDEEGAILAIYSSGQP